MASQNIASPCFLFNHNRHPPEVRLERKKGMNMDREQHPTAWKTVAYAKGLGICHATGLQGKDFPKPCTETRFHLLWNITFFRFLHQVYFPPNHQSIGILWNLTHSSLKSDPNSILGVVIIPVALAWDGGWSQVWSGVPHSVPGRRGGSPTADCFSPLISTFLILIAPLPKVTFTA